MNSSLFSFIGGVAFATGAFLLVGLQSGGPGTAISGDVREFLSHIQMVDLPDGQGGSSRTVRISGLNVQIVNGLGSTSTINGIGNLIVGYREDGGSFLPERTGSHNIVGGLSPNYSSYGGLVVGEDNWIHGECTSVTGGSTNVAAGFAACVAGGAENEAIGTTSLVAGGGLNRAIGTSCAVSGGFGNQAIGFESAIGGGAANSAQGRWSCIGGGATRVAAGDEDWVAGSLWEDN